MRRYVALWLLFFAAYAATVGLHASPGQRYTRAESHRLLSAASIADDHDVDLRDQYERRTWSQWDGARLVPTGGIVAGRRVEPQGIGFPLLIAPAYAIGGATAVELFCAALMALAFALGVALARRLVTEPWATRGVVVLGLSPPALAASTTIAPAAAGAALLAAAGVLALRVRERPATGTAFWSAALVAATPWIEPHLMLPAAVVALAVARWLRRRQRGLAGFVALEVVLTSAVIFVTINDRLFGGVTPFASRLASGPASGASNLADYLERLPRIVEVFGDPDTGLLRWAPMAALALVGLWLLLRSRRERLAVAVADQVDTEVTAGFLMLVTGAALASAVFARPSTSGSSLVAPDVVVALPFIAALSAWGLRRVPRVGALLVVLTLAYSLVFLVGARLHDGSGACCRIYQQAAG